MKLHGKVGFTSLIGIVASLIGFTVEVIQNSVREKEQQDYISSEVQRQLDERLGKNPKK